LGTPPPEPPDDSQRVGLAAPLAATSRPPGLGALAYRRIPLCSTVGVLWARRVPPPETSRPAQSALVLTSLNVVDGPTTLALTTDVAGATAPSATAGNAAAAAAAAAARGNRWRRGMIRPSVVA
jgi:hypothetical protein